MTERVVFVREARAVKYAGLFIWSILRRILLFARTIAPIGLPVGALVWLWLSWSTLKDSIGFLGDGNEIARGLSLLSSAGILSWFVTKLGKHAWDQFVGICKAAKRVLVEGWAWRSIHDLETASRSYIENMPKQAQTAFKKAKLLTISLTSYVFLVALQATTFNPAKADPPKQRDNGQTDCPVVAGNGCPETTHEIKLYMNSSAVFSLAYVDDAQPRDGRGICLDVPQQQWLREFRAAISNCMEEHSETTDEGSGTDDVRFKVTGYASIAPMHVDPGMSAKQNCKVANWRAAAVGAFLANPDAEELKKRWSCEHMGDDFNHSSYECGELTDEPYAGMDPQGNPFLVDVHQWSTPDRMAQGRPADDGEPNRRRFDVEILNRVVHIEVPPDFCGEAPQETTAP